MTGYPQCQAPDCTHRFHLILMFPTRCPICARTYHRRCYVAHGLTGHCEQCEIEAKARREATDA